MSKHLTSQRKKHAILHLFAGILILSAITIIIGIISSRFIEVNTYNIETTLSSPLRLVQITDLHNREFGKDNQRLVKKIESLSPDLICFTGDMLNNDNEDLSVVTKLIKNLSEIAPVYYGYGNHETSWEKNTRKISAFHLPKLVPLCLMIHISVSNIIMIPSELVVL